MNEEIPTIGRIVHVVWPDGVESPAIITRTGADLNPTNAPFISALPEDRWGATPDPGLSGWDVDLMVFGLTTCYPLYSVPCSNGERASQHWHWPERA